MRPATLGASNALNISSIRLLKGAVCLGGLALVIGRLWIISDLPLWLDETWSAMIAIQPDWGSFWREAWLDCNPPLYYALLKVWTAFAGDSNLALRLPSLAFTVGAAFAAVRSSPAGLGELGRWTWGALILFWIFGFTTSVDARGYGLLLLLSTLGCLAFEKVYRDLSLRAAVLWVGACSLMFLTHYFAAPLIAAQGLLLFYRHRLDILKVWAAGLVALPALAWFAYHFPRLQEYARPDVAWYEPLALTGAITYVQYVIGHVGAAPVPLVLLFVIAGLAFVGKGAPEAEEVDNSRDSDQEPLWATAFAGVIGLLLALMIGAVRASLTARYFVPAVPPMMLALVLLALRSRKRELIAVLIALLPATVTLNFPALKAAAHGRNEYGYEKASDFLTHYRPTNLVFAWDHPAAKILDRTSLEKIGSYFLRRSGLEFETEALILREHDNPNAALAQAADGERPAIIWLYNTHRKSAARHYPPAIEKDPAWSCHRFVQSNGVDALGAVACIKDGGENA